MYVQTFCLFIHKWNFYIQISLHKNDNATWVCIASFWKEAVLFIIVMLLADKMVPKTNKAHFYHYNDIIMSAMASQMTSLTIVYWAVYSGADQRKHQSFTSLAFVWGNHRWPVNSLQKGPVTRRVFPFDDIIMYYIVNGMIRSGKVQGHQQIW